MPTACHQLDCRRLTASVISRSKVWLCGVLVLCLIASATSAALAQPYARRSFEAHSHTERQLEATPAFVPVSPRPQTAFPTTVWGQQTFSIPYQWSGRQDAAAASQVVLHVSRDEGRTWSEASRARSDVQSFLYRAAGDGAYWFAVRTIDRTGRQWPTGPLKPELSVIVDTQIPIFKTLTARIDDRGQIQVQCVIDDATTDPTSLSVAYQATDGSWLPIPMAVDPRHVPGTPLQARGTAQASAGVRQVPLRAMVRDAASHPAAAGAMASYSPTQQPFLGAPSEGRPFGMATIGARPAASALPQVIPPYPAETSSPFALSSNASQPPSDPFLSAPQLSPSNRPIDSLPSNTFSGPATTENPFAQTTVPQPATSEAWPPDHRSASPYHPASAASPMNGSRVAAVPRSRESGMAGGLGIGSGDQYQFASQANTATSTVETLTVNQTRFQLDYDLQSVGEWGVAKVELWGTDNAGRSWRRYAVDSDNRSPITAVVPSAGNYGFRVLVQSVGGLEALPPEPGDQPDLLVLVDTEPPQVQLGAVHQGEGYFNDHLVINWQAADPNMAAQPISLSYSSRPQGPWLPIATSLDNTGRYAWRLQRHLPNALLVRLEVRDAAGNVATSTTPQPLPLHLPQAAGRIRAVRPLATP